MDLSLAVCPIQSSTKANRFVVSQAAKASSIGKYLSTPAAACQESSAAAEKQLTAEFPAYRHAFLGPASGLSHQQ
jgi:hypothetical protein